MGNHSTYVVILQNLQIFEKIFNGNFIHSEVNESFAKKGQSIARGIKTANNETEGGVKVVENVGPCLLTKFGGRYIQGFTALLKTAGVYF